MIVHFPMVVPMRPGDVLKINGIRYPITWSANLRYFRGIILKINIAEKT